jgi:hypothetical protein
MLTDVRVMRWLLFAALFATWPLPLFGLDGTLVPVLRFTQLATSLSILIALEGAGGMVGALSILLWAHVLIYGLILFVVASILVTTVLSRFADRLQGVVAIAAVIALVFWGSLADPYDTAFHHSNAHASLMDLYQ